MKNKLFLIFLSTFVSCSVYNPYGPRPINSTSRGEVKEFEELMNKDTIGKKQRTARVLTKLLNDDAQDKAVAVLIENNSNCNIIVRINGKNNYRLPILKNNKNSILIERGSYTFTSSLCQSKYYSRKNVAKSVQIKLGES